MASDAGLEQFEPALMIDPDALDDGILQQADLLYRVSQNLTLQISRRDAAKQQLAEVEAMADIRIRRAAEGSKTTEKEVKSHCEVDPKVIEATRTLLQLAHSVRQWDDLKEAIISRGYALKELVNLYVNNYYVSAGETGARQVREVAAGTARRLMHDERRNSA